MKIFQLQTFQKLIRENSQFGYNGKFMGIDFGLKHVGIAISDNLRENSFPFSTYERRRGYGLKYEMDHANKYFSNICSENQIIGVVVGFPLLENNELSPMCNTVVQYVQRLEMSNKFLVDAEPICTFWSEYRSTTKSRAIMRSFSNRVSVIKKHKDQMAASIILQSFLDHHNGVNLS